MDCKTKHTNHITGEVIVKLKRKFTNLEAAIKHAKSVNVIPGRIDKVVSYKCPTCHSFHVGRNGGQLKDKEINKWKPNGFKIVGKINL